MGCGVFVGQLFGCWGVRGSVRFVGVAIGVLLVVRWLACAGPVAVEMLIV